MVKITSFGLLSLCFAGQNIAHAGQSPSEAVQDVAARKAIKRVAVIGAGAAGTSAAYHINKFARQAGIETDISVFERNSYIGGRSTTVNAWDDPEIPVELGGSIFVKVNKILIGIAEEFNLSTAGNLDAVDSNVPELGVWNGENFVIQVDSGSSWWWEMTKLIWRYGYAPIKTNNLMKSVVAKFLKMYDEPVFPWSDLTEVVDQVGLRSVTSATGNQFLAANGIASKFSDEIIQASTRVNYAQNLGLIHGLETMVCMATNGAVAVAGGNWQMFSHMALAATPPGKIHLRTNVTHVVGNDYGRWVVYHDSKTGISHQDFDSVVLASPYQYSGISFPGVSRKPDEIPYVSLHVTLFASPHVLSPTVFNLGPSDQVPQVILTTLHPDDHPHNSQNGVGRAGFFSISQLRSLINPTTGGAEYLYKIFSPTPVNDTYLAHLLGASLNKNEKLGKDDLSWIYRKIWHSYPYEYPRVTFERIKLDEGLWYTSGIESFISTMETSALSGKNVAKLMVNEWVTGQKVEVLQKGSAEVESTPKPGQAPLKVEL